MIVGIVGLLGSGKTLLLTILGFLFHFKKFKVYSNYKTSFSEPVNPNDLLRFELSDGALLIDEAETLVDSRINTQSTRYLTYFGLQSRKRNVFILWTSQLFGAVDKRLRFITKWVFVAERSDESPEADFIYTLCYGDIPVNKFVLTYENAMKFFEMYDTTELIYPIELMGGTLINFNNVLKTYNSVPTKNSFVILMRKDYPYINKDDFRAVYELLRNDNIEEAKKVLGIQQSIEQQSVELVDIE